MNWYSIMKLSGNLFSNDNVVQAKNSKQALEKFLGMKVIRVHSSGDGWAEYSVVKGNEKGEIYGDKRKWVYYKVLV